MIKKPLLVYILFGLMILAAITYLLVAFVGEKGEGKEFQQAKAIETGQENLESSSQHMNETMNNDANNGTTVQVNKNNFKAIQKNNSLIPQNHNELTENVNTHSENGLVKGDSSNESIKRNAELPLFITAGIAYILIGLWMLLDKKGSRTPYISSTIGSIFLITLYIISHTIGLTIVGIEHVGILDLSVLFLQVAIIACSIYIIKSPQKIVLKY